jgi:hypothetical protein
VRGDARAAVRALEALGLRVDETLAAVVEAALGGGLLRRSTLTALATARSLPADAEGAFLAAPAPTQVHAQPPQNPHARKGERLARNPAPRTDPKMLVGPSRLFGFVCLGAVTSPSQLLGTERTDPNRIRVENGEQQRLFDTSKALGP